MAACLAGATEAAADRHSHRHAEAAKREPAQKLPPGPMQLVVSINKQTVTLYAGGAFVARAPVSTGVPGHPTPTGVFTVIHKERFHRSNLYSGAPMPFMQRITWSGVALHAGVLPGYPASHGCIRMPYEFAVKLYALTRPGVRVIVSRGDAAPVDIANSHLFSVKPKPEPPAAQPLQGFDALRASLYPTAHDEKRANDPAIGGDGDRPMIKIAVVAAGSDGPVPDGTAAPVPPAPTVVVVPRKPVPISVLVSRKTGKLYVRQNFQILFEAPVTIREPERPLGTHVFTAMELKDDGTSMRWTALTMPTELARADNPRRHGKRHGREEAERSPPTDPKLVQSAGEALDRIEMPPDLVERISEIITPGSSLIVSDQGISDETSSDTDFIILTR